MPSTEINNANEMTRELGRLPAFADVRYATFCQVVNEQLASLNKARETAERPLEVSVAVLGMMKSGKSTLLNALLGTRLLPAQVAATTAIITEISHRDDGYSMEVNYLTREAFEEQAKTPDMQYSLKEVMEEMDKGPLKSLKEEVAALKLRVESLAHRVP